MPKKIRRVVTGNDESGKAVVLFDGDASNTRVRPISEFVSTLLWVTDSTPAELSDADNANREIGMTPAPSGTIFRALEIPPESSRTAADDATLKDEIRRQLASGGYAGMQRYPDHPNHFDMHRTESIDYAVVLEGEIVMVLDDSETTLRSGDVIIMQGTYHAWANRSTEPCTILFAMIGARVPWR